MRSRSAKSVISPANSFASRIASLARATAAATRGSRLMSSTLFAGGGAGAGAAGGGVAGGGGGCSDIVSSGAGERLSRLLHQQFQHVERLGLAGDAERDVVGLARGDRVRVAFAIPSA